MGIITTSRKQNAIYWPPTGVDDYGNHTTGTLVELVATDDGNFRVRWSDTTEEFLNAEGANQRSSSKVMLPLLPDAGGEAQIGGYLWLGDRADLTSEADPKANDGALEIKRFDKIPNIGATEFVRKAYL